jgi:hypothetical protein
MIVTTEPSEPDRLGLISRTDLSAALGLPIRTLVRWESRGILPVPKRFGRAVFYDRADVADRLTAHAPSMWRLVARRVMAGMTDVRVAD